MELHSGLGRPGLTETVAPFGVLLNRHVLGHDVDRNHREVNSFLVGYAGWITVFQRHHSASARRSTNILAKLGARNRVELAALLSRSRGTRSEGVT
jgi:hypothetical protein